MEYHKKDTTIWDDQAQNNDHSKEDGNQTSDQRPVCIRVQLWYMNLLPRVIDHHSDTDSASPVLESSSLFPLS